MDERRAELMAGALAQYASEAKPGTVAAILDIHQSDIVKAVSETWHRGTMGWIKEPTGGGKTVIQAALVDGTKAKTLVVVPRIELIHQTTEEIRRRVPKVSVSHYYSGEKNLDGLVNITTYPSWLLGLARGDIKPQEYDFVVYDEGHHVLSDARKKAIALFDSAVQIAFTATPGYGKNKHLRDVFPTEISSTSIREAVESNRLCSFSVFLVKTGVSLEGVKVKGKGKGREFDEATLGKAVNIAARNKVAVDIYKQSFEGKQAMTYCAGVDHARALAENFNNAGIKAVAVNGAQSEKVQRELLRRYKAGEVQVICNADLLIEGFDDVPTSVILNLRPTLSPRLAEQRGGRALRMDKNNRGKYAFIVDFIDDLSAANSPISFAQVAEAAQLVNTWYQSVGQREPVGYIKPVVLDLQKAKVITDSKEVMWAVNHNYAEFNPNLESAVGVGENWKTLKRISAETGITLRRVEDLAERIISDLRFSGLKDPWTIDFRSPNKNLITYYSPYITYLIVSTVLFEIFKQPINPIAYGGKSFEAGSLTGYYLEKGRPWNKKFGDVDGEFLKRYLDTLNVKTDPEIYQTEYREFVGIDGGWKTITKISEETGLPVYVVSQILNSTLLHAREKDLEWKVVRSLGFNQPDVTVFPPQTTYLAISSILRAIGYDTPPLYYGGRKLEEDTKNTALYLRDLARKKLAVKLDPEFLMKYLGALNVREGLPKLPDYLKARFSERELAEIDHFKEEIRKANGRPIPLKTADGKNFYIQVRHASLSEGESNETKETIEREKGLGFSEMMLVNIFVDSDEGLEPIGYIGWSIGEKSALVRNVSGAFVPRAQFEQRAYDLWRKPTPDGMTHSRVREDYLRHGIGSLMLAASAVALEAKGVTEFDSNVLGKWETLVYDKFLLEVGDRRRKGPITGITKNPQTDLVIARWILTNN